MGSAAAGERVGIVRGLEPGYAYGRPCGRIPQSLPRGRFGWELPIRFYTDQEHRMEQRAVSGRNPYPPL